jgi:Growth regulator
MLVAVIPVGNSKGIRLPKAILDQLDIEDSLDLEVENHQIILKPVIKNPRKGWAEAFEKMHERRDDSMILEEGQENGGLEWEW